jgi:cytochrome c oxidase assembly factor CtaG
LSYVMRAAYLGLTALEGSFFGLLFLFATSPIYAHYAQIARTPDMITAVEDVHFAGAVMDGADTFILISVIMVFLGLWLLAEEASVKAGDAERARQRLAASAQGVQVSQVSATEQAAINQASDPSTPLSRPLRLATQTTPSDA